MYHFAVGAHSNAVNYSSHLSLTRITIENGCFFVHNNKYTLWLLQTCVFLQYCILEPLEVCVGVQIVRYSVNMLQFSRDFHCFNCECELCYLPDLVFAIALLLPLILLVFSLNSPSSSRLIYDQDRILSYCTC